MSFQQNLNKIKPKQLFLIDGLGAFVSAFLLGIILVNFESFFGMPREVLYPLAIIPCVFAVYSFFCFFRIPEKWRSFLKIIAIANLLYCCLTMSLVIYFYSELTVLGLLYFVLELAIILFLVFIELKMASNPVGLNV